MGIPAFFRWLAQKYPRCIVDVQEEQEVEVDGETVPIDTSGPNPNGIEFDALYLDMNGIIHPCCHPEDKTAPSTEEEMIADVFSYIDHLFSMVRPRKLLFMAIDGVAPRAKINQQRSRRFKAAQEAAQKLEAENKLRSEMIKEGMEVPSEKPKVWDSNAITPGTPFMDKLAKGVRYYVTSRLHGDPGWRGVKVILSDASVPGEGEHKIMDYIRKQRASPGYDPNMRHCIYGLDADLIMLSLSTHEPYFSLLREVVTFNAGQKKCYICGQIGHYASECQGKVATKSEGPICRKPFQFLHCFILKEYLQHSLAMELPFAFDLERAVDDWVFTCFLVGNDFLPHLPTLEIREGAIDLLTTLYKKVLPTLDGYITHDGELNIGRAMALIEELANLEDGILTSRRAADKRRNSGRRGGDLSQSTMHKQDSSEDLNSSAHLPPLPGQVAPMTQHTRESRVEKETSAEDMNHMAAKSLRASIFSQHQPFHAEDLQASSAKSHGKKGDTQDDAEAVQDEVRLGENGWRQRYYKVKFNMAMNDRESLTKLAEAYVTGLCWVLQYYYQGCKSWQWFYPYHYSPFAGEISTCVDKNFKPNFELGCPFRPFEQLMGVLPAASGHCVPKSYSNLMVDPTSPIIDFYPIDFAVDLNGKKFAWQGVVLLPFIDEQRLISTLEALDSTLSEEEKRRNRRFGDDVLFLRSSHPLSSPISSLLLEHRMHLDTHSNEDSSQSLCRTLDPSVGNISGTIYPYIEPLTGKPQLPGETYPAVLPDVPAIENSSAIACIFRNPKFDSDFVFHARILDGAELPAPVLTDTDLWEKPNSRRPGYFRDQNSAAMRMLNQPLLSRQQKALFPDPASTVLEEAKERFEQHTKDARATVTERMRELSSTWGYSGDQSMSGRYNDRETFRDKNYHKDHDGRDRDSHYHRHDDGRDRDSHYHQYDDSRGYSDHRQHNDGYHGTQSKGRLSAHAQSSQESQYPPVYPTQNFPPYPVYPQTPNQPKQSSEGYYGAGNQQSRFPATQIPPSVSGSYSQSPVFYDPGNTPSWGKVPPPWQAPQQYSMQQPLPRPPYQQPPAWSVPRQYPQYPDAHAPAPNFSMQQYPTQAQYPPYPPYPPYPHADPRLRTPDSFMQPTSTTSPVRQYTPFTNMGPK